MQTTYQFISAAFCVLVLFSNVISVKLVPLPFFDLNIPAGLLIYPFTFLLSDLVTEIFGAKKARQMVYLALGMNLLGVGILQLALVIPTHDPENTEAVSSRGHSFCNSQRIFQEAALPFLELND